MKKNFCFIVLATVVLAASTMAAHAGGFGGRAPAIPAGDSLLACGSCGCTAEPVLSQADLPATPLVRTGSGR